MPYLLRIAALAVGVSSLLGNAALAYPKEPISRLHSQTIQRMPPQKLSIRWVPVGRNDPSLSIKVANFKDMPRGGGIHETTERLIAFNQGTRDPIIRNGSQKHSDQQVAYVFPRPGKPKPFPR
jgi:hypothetical protein